jgi:hypothetical protein
MLPDFASKLSSGPMKKALILILLLLGGSAFAQISAVDANQQKARQYLDQMIAALGGPAYLNYQTKTEVGRLYSFYQGRPRGGGVVYWRFWKAPDKERLELTKQRDWVIIHNGDQGYEITFRGTAAEDADQHAEYLVRKPYAVETVLRQWLNAPGTRLLYEGSTISDDHPADLVTIMNAQDLAVTFAIDSDSHLPLRKKYTIRDPKMNFRRAEAEVYANWHLVQGIQTPYTITRYSNDEMTAQRFMNQVTYNDPIPDDKFTSVVTWDPRHPGPPKK